MNIPETAVVPLVALPGVILFLYSLIVAIGNHWILRAGGTSAHENYPKVMEQLKTVFIAVAVCSFLFYLVIFGFFPSDAVVALVSAAVGAYGAELFRKQK